MENPVSIFTSKDQMSEQLSPEEKAKIQQQYARMRKEYDIQMGRYYQLRSDLREHQRVQEQLSTLNEDRTAYKLIGDVVSQQTVGQLKPQLDVSIKNMQEACDKLEAYLGTRQKEIEEFMIKNQVKLQAV